MDLLATLINRGVEAAAAAAGNSTDNSTSAALPAGGPPPGVSLYSPHCYCGRKAAGLETGQIPYRGHSTSAGIWLMVSFSTIFLSARLYAKQFRLKGLWWDDWILIGAWASSVNFVSVLLRTGVK